MAKKSKRSNRDHAHKQQCPGRHNEAIAEQLQALLTPAVNNQRLYFRQLGLRNRILNLSLMLAAVLTMLWRQVPSVQELTRMLAREDLLWCKATIVSQQALSQRFLSFPAAVFERVFLELLPQFRQRWVQRQHRPLPASVQCARHHFDHIWIADGSTLEALFLKLKSFQDKLTYPGYNDVEMHYILCELDALIPPVAQEAMVSLIKESSGKEVKVHRLAAGHAATVSAPEKLAEIVKTIV